MSAPKRGRPAPRPSASARASSPRAAAGRAPATRPATKAPAQAKKVTAGRPPQKRTVPKTQRPAPPPVTPAVECAVGNDGRLLHDPGRLDDRRGREPQHHGASADRLRRGHLGDECLPAGLRRAAASRRSARRSVRTQEPVSDRPGRLHCRIPVVRAGRVHRDPHRSLASCRASARRC